MIPLVAAVLIAVLCAPLSCAGLSPPVAGDSVRAFAPTGRYSGHWGIDIAVPLGSPVHAAADGVVSFSGTVVGNRTVTVDHGGLRTSYSYLSGRSVSTGDRVRRGDPVGNSGLHDGRGAIHFSLRVGDWYVDPLAVLGCTLDPSAALWLRSMVLETPYPGLHASHPRRNV